MNRKAMGKSPNLFLATEDNAILPKTGHTSIKWKSHLTNCEAFVLLKDYASVWYKYDRQNFHTGSFGRNPRHEVWITLVVAKQARASPNFFIFFVFSFFRSCCISTSRTPPIHVFTMRNVLKPLHRQKDVLISDSTLRESKKYV